MRDWKLVDELKKLAAAAGVRVEEPNILANNGHYKIHGALLVNYYPLSAARTAYVAGTTKGVKNVTPAQAIAMSQKQPKLAPAHLKDERAKNSRAIRFKMMRGRETVQCHWCKAPLTLDTSTIEHVIPLDRGGLDNANNRVLACEPCNKARGNNMPELRHPTPRREA